MAIIGLRGSGGVPCAGNAVGPVTGTVVIKDEGVKGCFLVTFSVVRSFRWLRPLPMPTYATNTSFGGKMDNVPLAPFPVVFSCYTSSS